MQFFHLMIIGLLLGAGVYFLFVIPIPIEAVTFLIFALYFLVTYYERTGRAFKKPVYWITVLLLSLNGLAQIFIYSEGLINGLISFFFAFLTWKSLQRLAAVRNKKDSK